MSEYPTSAELRSVMNSRLPDQPVAITGLPSAMACAGTRPKPSERCREMTMSDAAISPSMSASGSMVSTSRILSAPAIASRSARSAHWVAPPVTSLITSTRSSASPKARRKAAMAASGFLRAKAEPRCTTLSTIRASSGRAHVRRYRHRRQWMRYDMHRFGSRGGNGIAGEARRYPDLMHVTKARLPVVRQAGQLPGQ